MKLLQEIVDQVAHDLRNPLNTIGMAAALLERAPLDAAGKQALERIERAGDRLAAMVDELADYARLELGELEVAPERCELEALLDEALVDLDEPQRRRLEREGGPLALTVDAARVTAALRALLNDALLRGEGPVRLVITAEPKRARLRIVRPTPLAAPVFKKLFEPSVKQPRRHPPRDLVFGLVVARAVIAAHGDELVATPEAFELTLPTEGPPSEARPR
jgi:signal transduction histidine kinase